MTDNAHILVVEDDNQIACLIHQVLTQEGYRVSSANNGVTALEILENETPDLILTDVIMGQMSGPKMVERMNARNLSIPVIFMSGYTDDRLAAHGFDADTISLIRKPFTSTMLLDQVNEALMRMINGSLTHTAD